MEKTEIIVDGVKYVKENTASERNCGVMDSANVAMVLAIEDSYYEDNENIIHLPKPSLRLKKNGTLAEFDTKFGSEKAKSKNGTIISVDYIKFARRIINLLNGDAINTEIDFVVYEGWNSKNEFIKDYPILLVYGNRGVMIAPRVEND